MRGLVDAQTTMWCSVSTEDLVPADHPIRRIKPIVDAILARLEPTFNAMYSAVGRPSIPPEHLLKASVLMAMYSVRSERQFCERLRYDMLFRWFLDMGIDDECFVATTFSKNRERLLGQEVADKFLAATVEEARLRGYVSDEHFTADGSLLEAWASTKSFRPRPSPADRGAATRTWTSGVRPAVMPPTCRAPIRRPGWLARAAASRPS